MHGKNGLFFPLSWHAEEACCLYGLKQEFEIRHWKTVFCQPQNIYVWSNCMLLRIAICIWLTWQTGMVISNSKGKFSPSNNPFVFLVSPHGLLSTTSPGMFKAWTVCSRPSFSVIALPGHSAGCPWQRFGREGCCKGSLCEERPGPALCQTQPVPASSSRPTLGHSCALCQLAGPSAVMCLRKGGNDRQTEEKEETKSVRNSWGDTTCLYLDRNLLAPVLPTFPMACPAEGGGRAAGWEIGCQPGPAHRTHFDRYGIKCQKEASGATLHVWREPGQGQITSFSSLLFPGGCSRMCSVQPLSQHAAEKTKFSDQHWHTAGQGQEIHLHITLGQNSGIRIPLPRGKLCELTQFWQIREFNGMDTAYFIHLRDQPWVSYQGHTHIAFRN